MTFQCGRRNRTRQHLQDSVIGDLEARPQSGDVYYAMTFEEAYIYGDRVGWCLLARLPK